MYDAYKGARISSPMELRCKCSEIRLKYHLIILLYDSIMFIHSFQIKNGCSDILIISANVAHKRRKKYYIWKVTSL